MQLLRPYGELVRCYITLNPLLLVVWLRGKELSVDYFTASLENNANHGPREIEEWLPLLKLGKIYSLQLPRSQGKHPVLSTAQLLQVLTTNKRLELIFQWIAVEERGPPPRGKLSRPRLNELEDSPVRLSGKKFSRRFDDREH